MKRLGPLLVALTACAGQATPRAKPSSVPEIGGAAVVSPARWTYHPPAPGTALAALALEGGGCVLTAPGGQRWVTAPDARTKARADATGRTSCAGHAEAATALAPEDLVAIARRPAGFWFAGSSGALYETDKPLAPFARTLTPPVKFARVTFAAGKLLGLSADGALYTLDEGRGFRALPRPVSHFSDFVADEHGRALALALPEALFASDDGGVTWVDLHAPPIGARRLGLTAKGELAAQGLFSSLVFAGGSAPPTRVRAAVLSPAGGAELDVGRAPSATAVAAGRAAIDAERYVEVIKPEGKKGALELARGRLDGKLDVVPLEGLRDCTALRVAIRGAALGVACVHPRGAGSVAVLRRSVDLGATWGDAVELPLAEAEVSALAVSPEGSLLVAGACKSGEPVECKAGAPVLVRGDPKHPTTHVSAAEQLAGPALLPAFSFDGHSAYFVGKRAKDDATALFVSHDGGETFAQRPLAATAHVEPQAATDDDDGESHESERSHDGDTDVHADDKSFLHVAEDGTVGLAVAGSNGSVYLLLDDDGRVLSSSSPPADTALLSGFGRRLIAVAPPAAANTGRDVALWESGDGGATWDEVNSPPALGSLESDANIMCTAAGCLLGDALTRLGWGGQVEVEPGSMQSADAPEARGPHTLTPIACELAPSTHWTRVDHVHGVGNGLPGLSEALRGRTVWTLLTHDLDSGAIGVVVAAAPERGGDARITARQLFAAVPPGSKMAVHLSHQIEGYFVVRAPYPVDDKGNFKPGGPMKNLELAWENFDDGTSGRARIADAGVYEHDDVQKSSWGVTYLEPGLVTVSAKSAYLKAHAANSKDATVFFESIGGAEQRLTFPRWPQASLFGPLALRGDAVTVDGQPISVGLLHESSPESEWTSTMVLARRPRPPVATPQGDDIDGWELTSTSIAPVRSDGPMLTRSEWTYLGGSIIGLATTTSDPSTGRAWSFFDAFKSDGSAAASIAVPTVTDLGDKPRPCSAADRATTPRIEARAVVDKHVFFPGARHPVLIREAQPKTALDVVTPLPLLTEGTIAHGTPSSPCAAAFVARSLQGGQTVSAILVGDATRGWLFRSLGSERKGPPQKNNVFWPSVEYRPMTCHFDESAKIPDAVWAEPGTR